MWNDDGLVGFVDWDMSGPVGCEAAAGSGDATYQQVLDHGSDLRLVRALEGLDEV